jgi:hypothetical protein
MPAVMNAIFVFTSRIFFISSRDSSVACLPTSDSHPHQVPVFSADLIVFYSEHRLCSNAFASVLTNHKINTLYILSVHVIYSVASTTTNTGT